MTTAQVWIEAAYNRSSANDPGKLSQDAELLDALNRIYQRLYSLFAKARPDEAASETTVTLSGSPATGTLPTDIIAVRRLYNATGAVVHLIPSEERTRSWHLAPSVYRQGLSLISRNKAGDPVAGDVLTLTLLDAPTAITALTTAIDARFPTRHHQLPVDVLALYLSVKDDGRNPLAHQKLVADVAQSASAFAAEYDLAADALEWIHADARRVPAGGSA